MADLNLSLLSVSDYELIGNANPKDFHSPSTCKELERIIKNLGDNLRDCSRLERKIHSRWKNAILSILVPAGEEVQGPWERQGKVKIEGVFRGDLRSHDEIIIGQLGLAVGDFCATSLICSGNIEGNILADGKVLLNPGARMEGKISAPSILIQEGAKFEGACKILGDKKANNFSWSNWGK